MLNFSRRSMIVGAAAMSAASSLPPFSKKALATYTTDTLNHGSIRFVTFPIDQWHLFMIPWKGGGLMVRDPISGNWRMHKVPFVPSVSSPYVVNILDCTIEGVPHQNMAVSPGPVYNAYVKDDGAGNLSYNFSQVRETLDNGFIVMQGDPNQTLIGRVGCLPYGGGIGFGGQPSCAMCASFFEPEHMSLRSEVGGNTGGIVGAWVEMVPFQNQLHFVCFGDGREPEIKFQGLVSNSAGTYNCYAGLSTRDADPPWSEISGGTSALAGAPANATLIKSGAGMGDGVELYQRFGLKLRVEGGVGSLPLGGQLIASVWM